MKLKKIIAVVLSIALCLPVIPAKVNAEENIPEGYTPIYTIADLYAIRDNLSGNYILMNDIDMTEETAEGGDWDFGNGWKPIDGFSGIFDGNSHRIIGMNIYGSMAEDSVGLFGDIGEYNNFYSESPVVIKNLAMIDININVTDAINVGGICGYVSYSAEINNCYCTGNIVAEGEVDNVGGIVGIAITHDDSGFDEFPQQNYYNLYNLTNIQVQSTVDYPNVGGILGYRSGWATYIVDLWECYNMGALECKKGSMEGGLSGIINTAHVGIKDCIYLKETADYGAGATDEGCMKLSEVQMQKKEVFTNFDFENTWEIDPSSTYPYPQLKANRHQRVEGIEIITMPDKTVYDQGEDIDVAGATVKIIYEGNYDTTVIMTKDMLAAYDTSQVGTQNITVVYGGKTATFPITVKEIPVTKVNISGESDIVHKGTSIQLSASVEPANATNQEITWSCNSTRAAVDASGNVTALQAGEVTIIATAANGVSAQYPLKISAPCILLMLDKSNITMYKGETNTLKVTLSPLDTTDNVAWSSSNDAIASVDSSGQVTALSPGEVQITATADSGIKSVCTITVKQKLDSFYIVGVTDKKYTGKKLKQEIEVTDGNVKLKKDEDYQINYTDNVEVGTAKVNVTGIGFYEGSIEKEFKILGEGSDSGAGTSESSSSIDKVKLSKLKNIKKRKLRIKYKAVEGAEGYEIIYSTKKKMNVVNSRLTTKTTYIISSLKKKKKYYVRVRAYYYGDTGEKVYGEWSKKKAVRILK